MSATPITTVAEASRRSPTVILVTLCLGVLIAQLDSSVVNLAVKRIGADLAASVSALQWVLDAYNLVYASLLLTGGTLGDLYGRRRCFALGVGLLALGSAVCGLAPGIAILIAGRVLTGVGAALVLPSSLALLAATYPEAKARAHAIGIWASCNGLAVAIGPTMGGLLVDGAGWRSIFLLVLPICAVALLLAWRAVPESAHPQGRRLDPPGQALAIIGLAALAFAVIEGAHWGWASPAILAAGALALSALALFILFERQRDGALVPLELFGRAPFVAALVIAALMTFGMYGFLFLLPIFLQTVRGHSAFLAGVELLPASLTFVVVSTASGRLAVRFGPRLMMAAGMAAMGVGLLMLLAVAAETPLALMMAGLFVIGVGLGLNTGPVMTVAVGSVPPARSGTASGLVNTTRMIGATLGIAVLGAIFAAHAGQDAANAQGVTAGMHAAFLVGGGAELLGALVALGLVPGNALQVRSDRGAYQ